MNVNWEAGDLAFIPAEVMILKIGKSGIVKRYKKTLKPKNVLILKPGVDLEMPSGENYCEILYNDGMRRVGGGETPGCILDPF